MSRATVRRLLPTAATLAVATLATFAGCAPAPAGGDAPAPAATGQRDEALVGGTSTTARPEVGWFNRGCTATLFAPQYVILAAHCLNYPNYIDTSVRTSDRFTVTGLDSLSHSYVVDKIYSFASARYEFTASTTMTTDIAILHLSTAVPSTVAIPAALASGPPRSGDRSTIFGFGCTNRSTGGGGGAKQYESFSYGTNTQALCPGDSGGPVFYGELNDGGAIWGINSDYSGSGAFSTWNDIFADVAYYKPQIEALMTLWDSTTLQAGINRPGVDYSDFDISTALACQTACANDGACRSFTYVDPTVSGGWGHCWLKSAVADWVPCPTCTSGVAPAQESYNNRGGSDYRVVALSDGRPELCESECARDAACASYTYVVPGAQGPSAYCWLKSSVPGASTSWATTSGVRRGIETAVDRPGSDYQEIVGGPYATSLDCASSCARDARCRSFTFVVPGAWDGSGHCFLKSAVASPVGSSWMVASGVRRGLELDTNRWGLDYRDFVPASPTPELCQAACAGEDACRSFTYVPPVPGGAAAHCWLKSGIPTRSFGRNMVSGIKGAEFF